MTMKLMQENHLDNMNNNNLTQYFPTEEEIKRVFKRAIIKIESYNPEYLKGINLDKVNAWLEKASFDQSSSIH